ncbi:uncharacterized protein C2orf42 homolog [Drosophila pseudoobscura]|uniref:Uncharacterized protein C2orf42 homolog n=1 Tax=Drosophila pseudoobscura pseudoobscura TaxID=46245 RepID=A0A6I8VQ99_DROPS|nr:uncharacterized protein C2orf42 homolog [Drosophila pseudoobscura]XP_033232909.1 uncharacterized protein C2orf42 homolog [Drosophila pseudoobscura]
MKISHRTLRGVRQCTSCGAINGNRAQLCSNAACPQNKNVLDAVSLISLRAGSTVCSLREQSAVAKVRETPRNFVVIQDVTLSLQPNAAVVSSKAICHVEACRSAGDIDCQHVKACRELGSAMPRAQVYKVSREVLWNLNIGQEQKQQLWQQYKWAEDQEQLPAVQRLNATTFAVKCERSDLFPTARLHVTALANGVSPKKGTYACACRKLKIIVEPDNSLVMQDEICDHLLLVLAGILSSPQGKRVYGNFTSSLKTFWMPSRLETPLGEGTQEDLRLGLSMVDEFDPQVDILVFGDHLDLPLPDLSDGAFNLDSMQAAPTSHSTSNSSSALIHYANDSQLLSNCDVLAEPEEQHIELTDCNIELMDQYQPTDQIDLDIELPMISEPYNILTAPPIYSDTPAVVTEQLPPIELSTIAVVKKSPVKATEIVGEVKTRKQPPLPAKRDLIVNRPSSPANNSLCVDADVQPTLAYSAWLDHVIELLNDCLEPECTPEPGLSTRSVHQSFHVHKETFSHFCKSFSAGIKRRPLHEVSLIESGKFKGLTEYVWNFTASQTVKRIFSTSNIQLQLSRSFERHADGHFLAYVRPPSEQQAQAQSKKRQIYTRLNLWMAKILLETGIRLSWTPDVLPRSHFGLMTVDFTVETRSPS